MQNTLFSLPTKPPKPKAKAEPQQVKKVAQVASLPSQRQQTDIFNDDEIPIAELILRRRHQMLVHSCLYYELNTNLISDKQFDKWGAELAMLQAKYPQISAKVIYAEPFIGWDGTTGFHLPHNEPWIISKACQLLRCKGGD